MESELLTPKFLSREVARCAVEIVLKATIHSTDMKDLLSRHMCHVVVLVPSMNDARQDNYPDWPNYAVAPYCLYERSIGDEKDWPHSFVAIARSKALQLWQDRNDDRTDSIPHLLFPGDTAFWGGVKRRGIVVTCSGVQPYFDKMIAGMTADMCVGLAYHAWMNSGDKKEGKILLT